MSCINGCPNYCDCSQPELYCEDDEEEVSAKAPIMILPARDAPSNEEWRKHIETLFTERAIAKINRPALVAYTLQEANALVHEVYSWTDSLNFYLDSVFKDPNGWLIRTRGPNGGVMRREASVNQSPPPSSQKTESINDYTCKSCGNDRCSKTEKSCWKCGTAIHS